MHEVAIVGAGFGGLGMAIRLKQAGIEDFVLLERGAEVGGTWWANSYPGAQCDIPSNLYSFSFAPKHDWETAYPMRDQILEYLRDCARRFDVLRHTRLSCELLDATWVAERSTGSSRPPASRSPRACWWRRPASSASHGRPICRASTASRAGRSTRRSWDHGDDLTGKRVALIGSGATAVQAVPAIQPRVGKLHLFQRTPPWVIPHMDHPVRPQLRELYGRVPALQRLSRAGIYALRELMVPGLTRNPRWLKAQELNARLQLRRQVPDPELRRRLTPDYEIGCKRIVLSNDWYPAIQAPNVELVSSGVSEVRERSVVDGDGIEREIDTLVFATGFKPAELPIAERLRGREGRTLAEVWDGSPEAYLGTTASGFPNLFMLYGPNLNLGHNSIVYMLESQINYVSDALRTMRESGAAEVEVRAAAQDAYNAEIQERLAQSVWNTGGCGSWYFDRNGRNSIQWPGFTFEFRRRTRRFDAPAYRLAPAARATSRAASGAPAA